MHHWLRGRNVPAFVYSASPQIGLDSSLYQIFESLRCWHLWPSTQQWRAEGLGCLQVKKFFLSFHLRKFLTTFFSRLSKCYLNLYIILTNHLLKILMTFFLVVSSRSKFSPSFLNFFLDAPPYHGCPGHQLFISYFLCIYPYFLHLPTLFSRKLPRWMSPT